MPLPSGARGQARGAGPVTLGAPGPRVWEREGRPKAGHRLSDRGLTIALHPIEPHFEFQHAGQNRKTCASSIRQAGKGCLGDVNWFLLDCLCIYSKHACHVSQLYFQAVDYTMTQMAIKDYLK